MSQSQLVPVVDVDVERGEDGHGAVTIPPPPPPPQHRVNLNAVADEISNTNTTTDDVTDLELGHVATTAAAGGGDEAVVPPPQHRHHQRHSQSYSRVRSFASSFMYSSPMHDSDAFRPYGGTSLAGTAETRTTFGAYDHQNNQGGLMVTDKFPLHGSVYSLIAIAPVFSWAFVVASYWIILKFALFTMLFQDATKQMLQMEDPRIIAARFLLIPVTVGMQGNLIHAVSYFARTKYDPNMTQIAANATRLKYNLSLVLEFADGILSLFFNAMVIMTTQALLDIFINFASLFFLQDIDKIGYELIEAGFFGRTMELWCHVIDRIKLPRRNSAHGKVIERVTTSLFFGVVILLLFLYSVVVWYNHVHFSPGDLPQGTNNTNSNN